MPQVSGNKADAAIALRMAGADYHTISETLGYGTSDLARLAVERRLSKGVTEQTRDEHRALANARYERLLLNVWAKAADTTDAEQLTAVRTARELVDRMVALNGAALPSQVIIHSPSSKELQDWVQGVLAHTMPKVDEADPFEMPSLAGKIVEAEVVDE